MDYRAETMQDDCYLMAAVGCVFPRTRIVETGKRGKHKESTRITRFALLCLVLITLVASGCGGGNQENKADVASILTFTRYEGGSGHVFAMNPDGSNERQVTFDPQVQAHSNLSPNGATVVYSQVNVDGSTISAVGLAGGAAVVLNKGSNWSLVPNYSPDGSRIAFTSDRDGNYEIYTMAADGTDVRQLTFTDAPIQHVGPKYSPDGTRLLYAKDEGGIDSATRQDLWVMPVNGGPETRLTSGINDRESRAWSPDGRRIVTQSVESGVGQLFVLNADGSGLRQITNIPKGAPVFSPGGIFPSMSGAVTPTWSPDGEWIAFASNHEGNYDIYLIRPDGSDLRRLTNTPQAELSVGWGKLPEPRSR